VRRLAAVDAIIPAESQGVATPQYRRTAHHVSLRFLLSFSPACCHSLAWSLPPPAARPTLIRERGIFGSVLVINPTKGQSRPSCRCFLLTPRTGRILARNESSPLTSDFLMKPFNETLAERRDSFALLQRCAIGDTRMTREVDEGKQDEGLLRTTFIWLRHSQWR